MKNKLSFIISKKFIIFIYLAVSMATAIAHNSFVDSRFNDINKTLHEQVLTGNAPAPIQYRILTYYLAEGLIRLGINFNLAWFLIRFAFTFLAVTAFHYFLNIWFNPIASLVGALFLLCGLPLTYMGYYMQPMDMPNLFFFIAGLIMIASRKDWLVIPLIFVSMLNRETSVLLVLVYLFYRWDELEVSSLVKRAGAMLVCGLGTYWLLRKVLGVKHYYSDMYYLGYNLSDYRTYLYALCLFGPFVFLAFNKLSEKPKFFRRALLLVPFFVIIHYTMTIMSEPRLWLPLLPIFIGGGLWAVMPDELKSVSKESNPVVSNLISKHPKGYYWALLTVFFVFFLGFFKYYGKMHLKDRAMQLRVENCINDSNKYVRAGLYDMALEQLNRALAYSPQNDNAHYELAAIYNYSLHDPRKALYHFEKCLEINPYHLERKRIQSEIDRLKYYLQKSAAK